MIYIGFINFNGNNSQEHKMYSVIELHTKVPASIFPIFKENFRRLLLYLRGYRLNKKYPKNILDKISAWIKKE